MVIVFVVSARATRLCSFLRHRCLFLACRGTPLCLKSLRSLRFLRSLGPLGFVRHAHSFRKQSYVTRRKAVSTCFADQWPHRKVDICRLQDGGTLTVVHYRFSPGLDYNAAWNFSAPPSQSFAVLCHTARLFIMSYVLGKRPSGYAPYSHPDGSLKVERAAA